MVRKTFRTMPQRRKREGKTDYKLRLKYLVSRKPRFVIRKKINTIIVQLVEYSPDGDLVKVTATSASLRKHGWKHSCKNIPAAYLTGFIAGKLAAKAGAKKAIVDLGMQSKVHGGRLFAALKGIIDSGIEVPASDSCFPKDERLNGSHIKNFLDASKKDAGKYANQFTKADVSKIADEFEAVKQKIMEL